MREIRTHLASRCGRGDNEDELAACVMQYITSVWHGAHPASTMQARNAREMKIVGECLDALLLGRLPELGDMLMQRLKALQQAHLDGHWQTATHLEVAGRSTTGLTSAVELREAVRGHVMEARLRDATSRTGRGGHGGADP